jgi:cobalt-precorrin 5A hydrolase/precorrin-3B C17-methyltransferase
VTGAGMTGRVLTVSITAAGRAIAGRLPYQSAHGRLAETVRDRWGDVDGFVLCCATGVAVRVIGPLLQAKDTDPAVVCVDEAARFAVALCGGHAGGANSLAREVAALIDATPVVTTASDAAGVPALDQLPGYRAEGDVAGVTRGWLDGQVPVVGAELEWPVPFEGGAGPGRVVVTDRGGPGSAGTVVLRPPSLVVGVGTSSGAPPEEARTAVRSALDAAGLSAASVACVATVDRRSEHPAVVGLGWPVRAFPADVLAAVPVPHPSPVVAAAVGTASVAEAAALLASGPGGRLVVPKQTSAAVTVAVARRAGPEGGVTVVGLGPGHPRHRTPAATAAVRAAGVVIGYDLYVEQCADLLQPGQVVVRSPIGAEAERCSDALARAAAGAGVALVCSGDPGVFAMATLVHELAPRFGCPPVEVVPGVTAASAAAALLGAPLAHDHAFISLSDLLTPWEVIERRLRAAAESDLAVALYNPRSGRRSWQLDAARAIFRQVRPGATPVGVVTDASRPDETVVRTTLDELDVEDVGMRSIVVVGSSSTHVVGDRLVTSRGYDT